MDEAGLIQRRQDLIGQATLFYKSPVHLVRGEGVHLFDQHGKRYVDLYNNVPCVGHANPRVVAAVAEQFGRLNVHSRYLHEGILDFAERLLALHHEGLEQVVFACSGTEASEIALMMARHGSGGSGIICTDATYHGNSAEVEKMSAQPVTDPYFRSIPFPQIYRPLREDLSEAALCQVYLDKLQVAIDDFAVHEIPFAGLFACSIFANEGLPDIPGDFMARATEMVHSAGGLVIADEVQAGYCRSGSWWGYQATGFTPDIVTMGKPMGNGMPVAAVAASGNLVSRFRDNTRYFNTFASSPVQAAAGLAVLGEIEDRDLLARSAAIGDYLYRELGAMQHDCDWIGDVRGCGLFVSVEWVSDKATKVADPEGAIDVAERLKEKGFLVSNAGAENNVVKIRPPLVFDCDNADSFLQAFAEVLREVR